MILCMLMYTEKKTTHFNQWDLQAELLIIIILNAINLMIWS